jgi:hypothetical protein
MDNFDKLEVDDIVVEGVPLKEKYPEESSDLPPEGETTDPPEGEAADPPEGEAVDPPEDEKVDPPEGEALDPPALDTPEGGLGSALNPPEENTDINALVNERFEGKYGTLDEVESAITEFDELLGDDFIKKAVEYYKVNKTLTPFLRAMSYDFEKMGDEEVLRLAYEDDNKDLSPALREKMFRKEVLSKFLVDEDAEPDEIEMAQALLKREANKQRQNFQSSQKEFTEPKPQEKSSDQEDQAATPTQVDPAVMESQIKQVEGNVGSLVKEGLITIPISETENFNIESIPVREMAEIATDLNKMAVSFLDEKNQIDWQKWAEAMTFIKNPEKFKKDLLNYGKSLGKESIEKDLKNPPNPNAGVGKGGDATNEDRAMLQSFAEQVQSRN